MIEMARGAVGGMDGAVGPQILPVRRDALLQLAKEVKKVKTNYDVGPSWTVSGSLSQSLGEADEQRDRMRRPRREAFYRGNFASRGGQSQLARLPILHFNSNNSQMFKDCL